MKTKKEELPLAPKPPVVGDVLDSLNHVYVYYNGSVANVLSRHLTIDGYNLGLKYQCVEFVKRYYYEFFHHKMPNSYGHAKDFFNENLSDGDFNQERGLMQYRNESFSSIQPNDILVFSPSDSNPYGHVAIVADVDSHTVEIIQQNPGELGNSRAFLQSGFQDGKFRIYHPRVLGWLRKKFY